MFVINEYMHEYTVYVLGVPDLLHNLWLVTGGDVPGDQVRKCFDKSKKKRKKLKNICQLDGLEKKILNSV